MIRLLVADDSAPDRAAVRTTLAEQPEISVVGEAADGQEALDLAVALAPDAVLLDVAMPVLDGVEATRRLREILPDVRIVAFTPPGEPEPVAAMLAAGADAHCPKGAPLWELERAIAGAAEPLVRLAHELGVAANARGASELVAREIFLLTGGGAVVHLAAPDVGLSRAAAAGPAADAGLASAPGVALRAFRTRALVYADAHELSELCRHGLPCAEALAVPLLSRGRRVGVVTVAQPASAGAQVDADLVSAVAELAGEAVANERRGMLTHHEERRDAVTGLPNGQALAERLDAVIAEGAGPVGLALLDLDGFERWSHRFGHPEGDGLLRLVARLATRCLRAEDEAYRVGGDEFAVVVPGGTEAAARVAGRVRRALRAHTRTSPLPTASAGIASLPDDALTSDELLLKATAALRAAKRAGGDRLVCHTEISNESSRQSPESGRPTGESGGGRAQTRGDRTAPLPGEGEERRAPPTLPTRGARVLVVDDDEHLRMLLRTTLEVIDIDIDEAASVPAARARIERRRPDVIVLDLGLPGPGGLTLCRELKGDPRTRDIGIVVLTGSGEDAHAAAKAAGADAFLRKPFSPLDLLAVVEPLAGGLYEGPFGASETPPEEQLLRYAKDLRRLLELERGQRALVQEAYRETIGVLTSALEAKDTGTRAHSRRVQRYAMELARTLEPALVERPSVEYGFLLHDVGKIGIPDRILQKPGALSPSERQVLQTHTVLGEDMLAGVSLLQGDGLRIVRHHHERWDGRGYPDGLAGAEIPLPARIFAVADALDAMTSDRPYRAATTWEAAVEELVAESARQFDPTIVDAFREREPALRTIYREFTGREAAIRAEGPGEDPPGPAGEPDPTGEDPHAGDDDPWLPDDAAPVGLGHPLSSLRAVLSSFTGAAARASAGPRNRLQPCRRSRR